MRIVQINGGVFGSTGAIMFGIAERVTECGGAERCFSPVTVSNHHQEPAHSYEKIGSFRSRQMCVLLDRISGLSGCSAVFATGKMLRRISAFQPDIIHLHNVHNSFVNLPMLFHYARKHRIKLVWTLHDCWAFTGHCPHFDMVGCEKWRKGCGGCPQYREYPKSFFDNSQMMYRLKKRWFTLVKDMTIVTPSRWLANLVQQSYLRDYPVRVINNGIDLGVFRPVASDFRDKHGCKEKGLVLGVAFGWGARKGLDVFIELAKRLDGERYRIVLVGTDDHVDSLLPKNIISIHRTNDQQELAEIYTAADVFVNPTREENYPTVNMEAIACGTPVLTFQTGGSPEILDETCGAVVSRDDVDAMEREIIRICDTKPFSAEACRLRAKSFDKNERFKEYVDLYGELIQ